MADALLDTSVVVDLLRRQAPTQAWLRGRPSGWVGAISVLTVFELLDGCHRLSEQRGLERLLSEFAVLNLSEPVSELALRWYKSLHLAHGVGALDCLIGATAKHRGLELFTLNAKHFRPMRGLRVLVPYENKANTR